MKAYAIQEHFGLEAMKPITLPDPTPAPGQVVVRIHAASLNYRDLMMITGVYNPNQPLPLVPLSDGAGEVVAVGAGVTRAKVGDRVAGIFTQDYLDGAYRPEYWRTSTLGGPLPECSRSTPCCASREWCPSPRICRMRRAQPCPAPPSPPGTACS